MNNFWDVLGGNFIVMLACMVPISIVAISSYFGHKRTEMIHQERMDAIEKGLLPPGELPDAEKEQREEEGSKPAPNFLRRGLFWLCPGGGMVAFSLCSWWMRPWESGCRYWACRWCARESAPLTW